MTSAFGDVKLTFCRVRATWLSQPPLRTHAAKASATGNAKSAIAVSGTTSLSFRLVTMTSPFWESEIGLLAVLLAQALATMLATVIVFAPAG